MIYSLQGTVSGRWGEKLHLQSGFMEWEIRVPLNFPQVRNKDEVIRVITYLHFQENLMTLFGFRNQDERELFLHVLKAPGVGARTALALLGFYTPDQIRLYLDSADAQALSRVPGLGLKTAQKMILALKGKLVSGDNPEESPDEVLQSLVAMGYERKTVEKVLAGLQSEKQVQELQGPEREKTLMRLAIIRLSSG